MPLLPCRECGQSVSSEAGSCLHCGCVAPTRGSPGTGPVPPQTLSGPPHGHALPSGNDPALLEQVTGWNWGAFFLNWIWAFAHRLPGWAIVILVVGFIPYVGIVNLGLAIYLGVKGSELAWERRPFRDLEDFQACQRVWRNWGIGVFVAGIVITVVAAVFLFAAAATGLP